MIVIKVIADVIVWSCTCSIALTFMVTHFTGKYTEAQGFEQAKHPKSHSLPWWSQDPNPSRYAELVLGTTHNGGNPLVIGKVYPSFQTLHAHWHPKSPESKDSLIILTPLLPDSCSFYLASSRLGRGFTQLLWI